MFIRRTLIAASLIAVPIAFAASAQATPACSYFGDKESDRGSQGICQGGIDPSESIRKAGENLRTNLSPGQAAGNLQDNFNRGNAAGNLEHNLTHGVGTDDPAE
jgi:hypothetical protein